MGDRGERLAQLLVLLFIVAALNALRRGELGGWAAAKFANAGAPKPDGARSFADLLLGRPATSSTPVTGTGTLNNGVADQVAPGVTVPPTLIDVPGVGKLSTEFGARWQRMANAAAADGIVLTGWGYRSNQRQFELRGINGCRGREYDRSCKGSPLTAIPGRSNHEKGAAVDVTTGGRAIRTTDPEFRWLVANAARFQIYNLPAEPWHWSIDGK